MIIQIDSCIRAKLHDNLKANHNLKYSNDNPEYKLYKS